jgi:hypothetical protein
MIKVKNYLRTAIGMIVVAAGLLACQNASYSNLNSDAEFYELMNSLEANEYAVLNRFPDALGPMMYVAKGNILITGEDTVQLINAYPNLLDEENRYKIYFMRDNHDNFWKFLRIGDKYILYRIESTRAKKLLGEYDNLFEEK